ncbi:MAG: hypothetical protein RBT34_07930 [Anaerolineaceae bacterium]|nr:hypothetical protein [Anaerolineaceae bacterium]
MKLKYAANVNNGKAEIRMDGALVHTLNQYAAAPAYQREWTSPLMADEGPHTITITHTTGTIIDVDALLVSNPTTPGEGTYEDTSPLIAYSGSWNPYAHASASGGSSRYSNQVGSTAQFNFEGNQVSVVYTGLTNRGLMNVYIDGALIATINQKTSALAWKQQWDSPLLSDTGPHTLQLVHSSGAIADIDAIIVTNAEPTPTPTGSITTLTEGTYDDTEPRISYSGKWTIYNYPGTYNGGSRYSEGIGDTATFEFFGTQLSLLYLGLTNRGNVTVKIDSQIVGTVNQYTAGVTTQNRWDSPVLDNPGPHTVVLTHATGYIMDLDAVIITGGGEMPTPTDTATATVSVTFTPTATPEFDPPDGKEVYRSSYAPAAAGDNPESESADLDSYGDSITGNGQYTVFASGASNLIYGAHPCETTGFSDIYMHNRQTGTNTCLSTMFGAAVDGESVDPFISDTGQFVVFASRATDFTSGSAPVNVQQIYLINRAGNEIIPVSRSSSNDYADADSYDPYVTPDGQYVIFYSDAANLVPGDTNGVTDVFIRDMGDRGPDGSYSGSGQATYRVSVANDGGELSAGSQGSVGSFVSDDGQYAVFTSDSPDITGDGTGTTRQVFVRDLDAGTTSLVSKNGSGEPGNDDSWAYNLTAEGKFVMFYSKASDLVAGGNTTEDAYVYDLQTGVMTLVSLPAAQVINPFPAVDGGKIVFETAKGLVPEDTNGRKDVYLRKSDGTTMLVSLPLGATNTGVYASFAPAISTDGRFVAFTSMVNALDPVDNPPSGGEPNIDNLYIRQIDGRWEGPTAGIYDDDDSRINYNGSWPIQASASAYGGEFHYSNAIGNSASFTFKGRQISIIYAGFTNRGSAEIKINGQVVDTLNQYTPTLQWQRHWNSPILANNGPHTLVITQKTAGVVSLDALEVSDTIVVGPGIYDDAGGQIQFQGSWTDWPATGPYNGSMRFTNANDAAASLTFYGMQVSLVYTKYTTRGDILIQIDDGTPVTLNQHSDRLEWQHRWDSPDLDEGIHTIKLSHPGGTHYIDVDAIIVTFPAYELDPPSPITDLAAATGTDMGSVDLTWTATGDDFQNGTASQYIVRYSTSEITSEEIWAGAADVEGEPVPQIAGSAESMTVTGLPPGQFYYFAIRARDDGANLSGLGNSAGATAQSSSNVGAGTYDDNNANIIYSGTWSLYNSSGPYNDSLHLCNTPGSTASFTFTGTQISLIYTQYTSRGNLEISIDGGDPVTLNLYGSLVWQKRWDSPLLQPGTHTIVLRHPGHTKYIDVDAFIVSNPETIPPVDVGDLLAYTGPDKGSIDLAWTAPGDDGIEGTASEYIFRYAESAINTLADWEAAKDLTGEPVPSVSGTAEEWRVTGLDPTKIYHFAMRTKDDADNISGLSNSADAQPNLPPAVGVGTYDNASDDILYTGTWTHYNVGGPYNKTLQYTNVADNKAVMQFTGTMVSLLYTKYTSRGNYEIIIDGGAPITLNAYGTALQWQQRWDSELLSEGTHTLVIRNPGGGKYIDVDAIIVSEPEAIPPAAITDLSSTSGAAVGSVSLSWTAPGDDDMTGTASSYIVRYASSPIDSQGAWDAATDVSGEPAPVAAGGAQSMVVSGLVPGNTYYFAIRTLDDVPNTSGLSNSPSAAAKAPDPVGAGTYDDAGGSIAYVGIWQTQAASGPYNSTMHYTNATNAAAYFSFTGTQFTLVFTKISSRGNIEIIIDGGEPILVNQYNATLLWQQQWVSPELSDGTHTIAFRHPGGTKYISMDAIIVAAAP